MAGISMEPGHSQATCCQFAGHHWNIGCSWSYLACRIGHLDLLSLPYVESSSSDMMPMQCLNILHNLSRQPGCSHKCEKEFFGAFLGIGLCCAWQRCDPKCVPHYRAETPVAAHPLRLFVAASHVLAPKPLSATCSQAER
jgi:hypothetical protein